MALIPDEPEAIQIQKQRENFIVKKVIEQGSLLEILRIFMYVCMYVCMYVRVGFREKVRMHIFLFACKKLQIKHSLLRKYLYMYVCMYVCMYV